MATSGGGGKWLKYGCLGCVGILALVLLAVAVLVAVAAIGVRSEEVAERTLVPELPARPPAAEGRAPDSAEPRTDSPGPGKVVLDLRNGGFHVQPALPGEPLRVDARYDASSCELREKLDTDREPGWVYRLTFRCESGSLMHGLKALLGGTGAEVRIHLPDDVPLELEFDLTQSQTFVELGGLWVTSMDVDFDMAGFDLSVGEPLKAPMDECSIRWTMANLETSLLGNASPRRLELDYNMGGMELDLRGRWSNDSDIELQVDRASGELRLPDDVVIEGLETGRVSLPMDREIPPPTLRFSTDTSAGELVIVD
jgi:hypothetical protein